jgi:hypothetical protein
MERVGVQVVKMEPVMRSARQPLLISGLQVQVLRGSPLSSKHLATSAFSCLFVHCGDSSVVFQKTSRQDVLGRAQPFTNEAQQ